MDNGDREVLQTCVDWIDAGYKIDLVTVARTWGSSPRPLGSVAAVREDGVLVGSVSGGCVEKQLAESFRVRNVPATHTHHIDDSDAKRFGLACGGELELLFESLDSTDTLKPVLDALDKRKRISRCCHVTSGTIELSDASANTTFSYDGSTLVKVYGPPWRLLIIGAGQLSRFVAQFAEAVDFDVLVCEPRPEFRDAWNVESATLLSCETHDAAIQYANDEHTAVLALTHDPNLDDAALLEALPSNAFFIGALGSRRNYENRCKRLGSLLEPEELARLKSPVGLPIGSRSSAEIAISAVAELVKERAAITRTR